MQPTLGIVVPCYNEQEVLQTTIGQLTDVINTMIEKKLISSGSKVFYVDDGSKDSTWEIIKAATHDNPKVNGIKLAGNCGHQNALIAGLSVAVTLCDAIISIDADLQDDTSVIETMVRKHIDGADIVYGVRQSRATDTYFKKNSALLFYRIMNSLGAKTIYNHADYRLMSKRAVDKLLSFRERNLFIRGIVPTIGYKTDVVYYDRHARMAGESKYPLKKMISFAVDGITSFSIRPIRMIFSIGILMLIVTLTIALYVLISYFGGKAWPGWTSLMLSLWFISSLILISLGIIGEYIGKIYIEVKDRPRFFIEKSIIDGKESIND